MTCTCSKHAWNPNCPKHGTLRAASPPLPPAPLGSLGSRRRRTMSLPGSRTSARSAERPGQAARRGRLPAPPLSPFLVTVTEAPTANPDGERRAAQLDTRMGRTVVAAGVAESGPLTSPSPDSGVGFTSAGGQGPAWSGRLPAPDDYLIPNESGARKEERDDRVIWKAVKRAGERAGVDVHVHALRAAFAVFYLEQNAGDLEALQPLMGHASIATTQVYLRRLDRGTAMERVRGLSWA
jgi:hypothetical protein